MTREFLVAVERDEERYPVASMPSLKGCHTQARSMDELMKRIREAIQLCLEVEEVREAMALELVGIHKVAV